MAYVNYEISDRIAVVTIDNPPMNAMSMAARIDLGKVFEEMEDRRDDIAAAVLTGAGDKAFVAGANIKAFLDLTPETAKARIMKTYDIYGKVESFTRPVIAAIHGYCLGGGLELALCCDIRYASEDAVFGFPEVNLSIFPGNSGTVRALHFLTVGKLKELVFSGDRIDAVQALNIGLIEKIVPTGRSLEAAVELAKRIAKRGPLGVAAAKQVINRNRDLTMAQGLELESDAWADLTKTEDMREGALAFLEKRKPTYRGR